jgi:paraquat-inducible protein B
VSKQASPALIGSFVLGGAALLVLFVLIIVGDSYFKEERKYLIYFSGTIYGLKVGSNVMFRGVPIGYVSDIDVLADFEDMEFTVPVTITIQPDSIRAFTDDNSRRAPVDEDISRLIDSGLRATLASESLITGQLYIELDFQPATEIVFRGIDDDLPEIPSIPSGIQEVIKEAQSFITDIQQNLDVPKVMADVTSAIEGLDALINAPSTQNLTSEFNQTLATIRSTLDTVDNVVAKLGSDVDPAVVALIEALETAESVLTLAEVQLRDDSDIAYRLGTTLKEVESAARAIRVLAEQLDEQPESVLKGKK